MTMLNEHLEHEIKQQLLANEDLSSQGIEVTANGGQVTLQGRVQSFRRKLAAQQIAQAIEHVSSVDNRIRVVPTVVDNDVTIVDQVNKLIDSATDLTGEPIQVSANDQTLALTGYVSTEHEKIRAADIAASVDGVLEVNNFLVANPDQVLANRKHCQSIQNSIASLIGMEKEEIRISVVNDTARINGEVDASWKREIAEEVTRQFGILTVSNEVVVRPKHYQSQLLPPN